MPEVQESAPQQIAARKPKPAATRIANQLSMKQFMRLWLSAATRTAVGTLVAALLLYFGLQGLAESLADDSGGPLQQLALIVAAVVCLGVPVVFLVLAWPLWSAIHTEHPGFRLRVEQTGWKEVGAARRPSVGDTLRVDATALRQEMIGAAKAAAVEVVAEELREIEARRATPEDPVQTELEQSGAYAACLTDPIDLRGVDIPEVTRIADIISMDTVRGLLGRPPVFVQRTKDEAARLPLTLRESIRMTSRFPSEYAGTVPEGNHSGIPVAIAPRASA